MKAILAFSPPHGVEPPDFILQYMFVVLLGLHADNTTAGGHYFDTILQYMRPKSVIFLPSVVPPVGSPQQPRGGFTLVYRLPGCCRNQLMSYLFI